MLQLTHWLLLPAIAAPTVGGGDARSAASPDPADPRPKRDTLRSRLDYRLPRTVARTESYDTHSSRRSGGAAAPCRSDSARTSTLPWVLATLVS